MTDFAGVKVGQVVMFDGKQVVFVDNRLVRTCGCCNVPNVFPFPHVAHIDEEGRIELTQIREWKESPDGSHSRYLITEPIGEDHDEYGSLKKLLEESNLMPAMATTPLEERKAKKAKKSNT
jgi:hypothetical protein